MDKKMEEFLVGLTELTRRTGVAIGGCGCCESPYMFDPLSIVESFRFDVADPNGKYVSNNDGGNVEWRREEE